MLTSVGVFKLSLCFLTTAVAFKSCVAADCGGCKCFQDYVNRVLLVQALLGTNSTFNPAAIPALLCGGGGGSSTSSGSSCCSNCGCCDCCCNEQSGGSTSTLGATDSLNLLSALGLGSVLGGLGSTLGGVGSTLGSTVGGVGSTVGGVGSTLGGLGSTVGGLGSTLGGLGSTLGSTVGGVGSTLGSTLGSTGLGTLLNPLGLIGPGVGTGMGLTDMVSGVGSGCGCSDDCCDSGSPCYFSYTETILNGTTPPPNQCICYKTPPGCGAGCGSTTCVATFTANNVTKRFVFISPCKKKCPKKCRKTRSPCCPRFPPIFPPYPQFGCGCHPCCGPRCPPLPPPFRPF